MHIKSRAEIANLLPNNYIARSIHQDLMAHLSQPEVTILYGARQVGKSSEVFKCIEELFTLGDYEIFYFNLDVIPEEFKDPETFISTITPQISDTSKRVMIFIDEAQRFTDIGLFVKYIYDKKLGIKFILTGSASLDIKEKVKEPLTGRKEEFSLSSLSLSEILEHRGFDPKKINSPIPELSKVLEEYLIFGGYPGVVQRANISEKRELLQEITDSYIKKDIVELFDISSPRNIELVANFLAENIGNTLSKDSISNLSGISKYELEKILAALEKVFVVSMIHPFATDRSRELIHRPKVYFKDLGIRNALSGKLNELQILADKGHLFENTVVLELGYKYGLSKVSFWRTDNQTEVDFVVRDSGNMIRAYEVKLTWTGKTIPRNLASFAKRYSNVLASAEVVTVTNLWKLLS